MSADREREPLIAPDTLAPVVPHGDVDDDELANVRIDGPEPVDADPVVPDPAVEIDED